MPEANDPDAVAKSSGDLIGGMIVNGYIPKFFKQFWLVGNVCIICMSVVSHLGLAGGNRSY